MNVTDDCKWSSGPGVRLNANASRICFADKSVSEPLLFQHGDNEKINRKHEFHIEKISDSVIEFWQTFRNEQKEKLEIIETVMFEGAIELNGHGWRIAHSELFKCDFYFGGYNFYTGDLFSAIEKTEGHFGLSEDFPFPGIIFTHPERGTLLMGVVSQDRCKPNWEIKRVDGKYMMTASEYFNGVPSIVLKKHEEYSSERWLLIHVKGKPEDAINEYHDILQKRFKFIAPDSILRDALIWGTWNYNRRPRGMWDITHDWITDNARAFAEMAPDKKRVIIIDDGYQGGRSAEGKDSNWYAYGFDIFHAGYGSPHDPALFPSGMKGIAEEIRKTGAAPGLWITPRIHKEYSLAKSNPDWLLQVEKPGGFAGRTAYLDYSVPEVREFTRNAWKTIFHDWGFKGIKLDFWSMAFEINQLTYRHKSQTGIELRNLFLKDLREFVPADGFVLTACVVNGGNPFNGRFIDAARAGLDISGGWIRDIVESASWLSVVSPFYNSKSMLCDSDSAGWNQENTSGENRLWITTALMTGSVTEFAGDLTSISEDYRKALDVIIEMAGVYKDELLHYSSGFHGKIPSDCFIVKNKNTIYEARLNWMGHPKDVKIEKDAVDLWTGEKISGRYKIPARDAIILKYDNK